MGKIYYVMGKSASGKDTVYKRLLEARPQMCTVVLYTTRPGREGETDGVEYHFTTAAQLAAYQARGRVIESRTYQTVCGPWTYATVDDGQIDLAVSDYLIIGTLESYERIRAYFGADAIVPIYVYTDDGIRLERAVAREKQQLNPNYRELCRRYLADEEDFSEDKLRRAGIERCYENTCLDTCLQQILKDIGG